MYPWLNVKIYLVLFTVLFSLTEIPAQSRYTKGAENGYAWIAMDDPQLPYNNSKYNYLNELLEKSKLMKSKFSKYEDLFCNEEINYLLTEGKSKNFSLDDVVKQIDKFYSKEENLKVPIVFAYCYVIKKEAGLANKKLNDYRKSVQEFCNK